MIEVREPDDVEQSWWPNAHVVIYHETAGSFRAIALTEGEARQLRDGLNPMLDSAPTAEEGE